MLVDINMLLKLNKKIPNILTFSIQQKNKYHLIHVHYYFCSKFK